MKENELIIETLDDILTCLVLLSEDFKDRDYMNKLSDIEYNIKCLQEK